CLAIGKIDATDWRKYIMLDYSDWILLITLLRKINITHAADHLYISQNTLSSRVKIIEHEYGIQIVVRCIRGVSFTLEGILFAQHAKEMLQEQTKVKEKINNLKNESTCTLKVGVSNFFALNKMPKLLRLFQQKHPGIECQVVTGWSSDMYRLLINHDVH